MGFPGTSDTGLDMGQDLHDRGCERSSIKVEVPLHLCVRGKAGVEAGGVKEVECYHDLGQRLVPELYLEIWVASAQDSHKVVFQVQMAHSAVFLRWEWAGINW